MSDSSDAVIDRPVATRSTDFLGHPRGLTFLFATEMWERFSYYGMRALLVLYMVKYLLQPNHMERVFGLPLLRHGLEVLSGPLDAQPLASQIYGLYTGLVYLTPLFGGMFADRVLGQRRTVIIGAVLMAVGHFMMAFEQLLLFALLALIFGSGAFKPNISTQVGGLYQSGDHRRDRAYSIFYVGINLGAFLAPLICGTLGEAAGWHYGFAAAGVGMLIGLAIYLYAWPLLPQDELSKTANTPAAPLSSSAKRRIVALLVLFLPATLFWATYEQQGNTVALWADAYTDRTVHLIFWTIEIPTTWFQSLNPIMIVAFTPLVVALWARQAKSGSEPSTVTKMALGCLGVALANLIMTAAALDARPTSSASSAWLLAYFTVVTIGELYLSPTSLSLVSKIAPARFLSMLMGLWLATSFVGNLASGWLGSFWSSMEKAQFFLMIAAIAAAASAAIFAVNRPLAAVLDDD
jgi:proton-dependent oligopeptide transporter, POT family